MKIRIENKDKKEEYKDGMIYHDIEGNIIMKINNNEKMEYYYLTIDITDNLEWIKIENYENMKLDTKKFYMGNLNQCRHYNRVNITGASRVSFDIRIIPGSKYKEIESYSVSKNIKFTIGNYYMKI